MWRQQHQGIIRTCTSTSTCWVGYIFVLMQVCSLCRYEKDHKAMGSKETPNCTKCGMDIGTSVRY